ncbi:signal peptidase I [Geoalkalibacter subterraneus]|uniref:signal peptidase I n=1 Tax=Geoalkalibacter subterraneus TaxID=483547 RepID=UPI0009FBB2BB|nr:signal peptidase I [Geoalkalibacter subterraneus]
MQAIATIVLTVTVFHLATSRFSFGLEAQEEACLPYTLFVIDKKDTSVALGDFVAFYADERTRPWFEPGTLMIKEVRATAGDRIRIEKGQMFINDAEVDYGRIDPEVVSKIEEKKKVTPSFDREMVLEEMRFWVMGNQPRTFDSRYWGPISSEQIVGQAYPLF